MGKILCSTENVLCFALATWSISLGNGFIMNRCVIILTHPVILSSRGLRLGQRNAMIQWRICLSFFVQTCNICFMLFGILLTGWLNDTREFPGLDHHALLSVFQMYIYTTKQDLTVSIPMLSHENIINKPQKCHFKIKTVMHFYVLSIFKGISFRSLSIVIENVFL